MSTHGRVVILNGPPRSGKSSIAAVIQERFDGPWMNLGVDVFARQVTPPRYRPGIGLRPGGERPDIEALIPALYAALYDSVAAHSRAGLNVVVDVAHHDDYSRPLDVLPDAASRLADIPVLFVGVRCPIEVIMRRRDAGDPNREGTYAVTTREGSVPAPVRRWQDQVHRHLVYDLEVDTSILSSRQCAQRVEENLRLLDGYHSHFHRLSERRRS